MTDPTPNPAPTPNPTADPSPAPATRPDWLPESHWDDKGHGIKPEFGQHYNDLATFHKTESEKRAALAGRKPDDIKFEFKPPADLKIPEGMQVKIDDKDPRIAVIRDMALKRGWDQDTVNELVVFDAKTKIEAHNAEIARVVEEDKKLGANVKERKDALTSWAVGLRDRGDLTKDEFEEVRQMAATAAGVTALEKLRSKIGGSVPSTLDPHQPQPPAKRREDVLYPQPRKAS